MDSASIPEWVMWLGAAAGSMLGALVIRLGWKSAGGEKPGPSNGRSFTLDAALVDSASVKHLTASIEAATVEAVTQRLDAEKGRQLGYRVVEVLGRLVDETGDLRREVGDLAKEVARRK